MSGKVQRRLVASRPTCRYLCRYGSEPASGDTVIPLTSIAIRSAKGAAKPYKLADGGGLYLLVNPHGSKLWRFDYRYDAKRKTLALGAFPELGLAEARGEREAAKSALRLGADPSATRRSAKFTKSAAESHQLAAVAERWFCARRPGWVSEYAERVWSRVDSDVLSHLGDRHVASITSEDVLRALRAIEGRGAVETARRVKNYVQDIFSYAKAEKLLAINPAEGLDAALTKRPPPKRRAALQKRELPDFIARLAAYDGDPLTRAALRLTLLTVVRTSEIRFAHWAEFEDLRGSAPLWRIPAARMKMRTEHLVPLAPQAIDLLTEVRSLTEGEGLLFATRSASGVISENTMLYALYRLGYHHRATVHGFRGTASTILNEHGFNRDWIERQLAHVERDHVRAAYNAAEWLPDRRTMMCWWANYLESCSATS